MNTSSPTPQDQLNLLCNTAELRYRLIAKWLLRPDANDTTNRPAILLESIERPLETTHD